MLSAAFHKIPLRPLLMILTAATAAYAVSGALLPIIGYAQRYNGSFIVTVDPSSVAMNNGTYCTSTITLISVDGYAGTVALSTTYTYEVLPTSFFANTVDIPAGGTATTTLTVAAPANVEPGQYGIVITGTRIGHGKSLTSSALLLVEVTSMADFSIRAEPSQIDNQAGSSSYSQVLLTSHNGFNGTVGLTATIPFGFIGVTGGQDHVFLPVGGIASTTLQITTTQATLPGTYIIKVTGTSGSLAHSATITILVGLPSAESLRLTSYSFGTATSLTLNLENTGAAQIVLKSYRASDSMGNTWVNPNWAGPALAPGETASADILIWTDCSSCYYTGIFGLFTEFVPGRTYTVVLTMESGNEFTFTVTR